MNEIKKLILALAMVLALAACAGETRVVVVTATPIPPTITPVPSTVTPVSPTVTPIPPTFAPETWDAEVNVFVSANLHQLPHNSSQIMATLMEGTEVDLLVVTEDQEWVQATEGGSAIKGWLRVDKLTLNVSLDDLEVDTETTYVLPSPEGDQPAATPASEPTPLGGGGKIAFSSDRDGDFEIYLMNSDGTNQIRLTNRSTYDFFPEFSPDGDTLLFFAVDAESDPPSGRFLFVGIDGTHQGTFGAFGFGSSSWSPDGTKIAFVSGDNVSTQIYTMNYDGTEVTQVTDGPGFNEHPTWSPDGTMLAFWSDRTGNLQIYAIRSDGAELTRLTSNAFNDENPDWAH